MALCTNIPYTGPLFGLGPCDAGDLSFGCEDGAITLQHGVCHVDLHFVGQ